MGIMESTLGNLIYKLLMPKEVPDWYSDGRKLTFPQAPPDSLLLLGDVILYTSNLEAAGQFYFEALGGGAIPKEAKLPLHVPAGSSRIRLLPGDTGEAEPRVWPGHIYLWVADIRAALERCQALQAKLGVTLVEDVHNIIAADTVDAVELTDPDGNSILLNQAPKGFREKMSKYGSCPGAAEQTPNVLALIEAVHAVPPGAAPSLARFYRHFFGAAVSTKQGGWAVHFSAGRALRQTLLFVESAEANDEAPPLSSAGVSTIFVYLPSEEKFAAAYEKCREAGLLLGEEAGASAEGAAAEAARAKAAGEFRVRRCLDPQTQKVALEMETVIRLRDHVDCPLEPPATS
mmetsp:Transcript_36237/g.91209  ORF Transcript_36237/g.91209 Transcript_36237/m.91209 type:complete len:346 (-) Transcript_36237:106-1143(-)